MKKSVLAAAIALVAIISACVEPYDLSFEVVKSIFIVDGELSDDPTSPQQIKLLKSVVQKDGDFYVPVKNVKVQVTLNEKSVFDLNEGNDGIYLKPDDLVIAPGNRYQLKMVLPDGSEYVSETEEYKPIPPIKWVFTKLEVDGYVENGVSRPAHHVFLTTDDPPETGNNYLWTWLFYEKQPVCKTCEGGTLGINRTTRLKECQPIIGNSAEAEINDYTCEEDCWQIFKSKELLFMTDRYINGRSIEGKLLVKIPIYQSRGSLFTVRQQSVSDNAIRYYKLLADQAQNVGSLADTPPAALVGNVRNVNDPREAVAGFFKVSGESSYRLWIDRKDVAEKGLPIRGILGRVIMPDPRPFSLLAPCLTEDSRTNKKPDGWIN